MFKKEGLVIIDGDSKELKKLFIPFIKKELIEQTSYSNVLETNSKLEAYKIQVNPRENNLFYEIKLRIRNIYRDFIKIILAFIQT